MRADFFPTYSESSVYDRDYSIMARLNVSLDFRSVEARRFFYIADCVARDVEKENKQAELNAARARFTK